MAKNWMGFYFFCRDISRAWKRKIFVITTRQGSSLSQKLSTVLTNSTLKITSSIMAVSISLHTLVAVSSNMHTFVASVWWLTLCKNYSNKKEKNARCNNYFTTARKCHCSSTFLCALPIFFSALPIFFRALPIFLELFWLFCFTDNCRKQIF